MAAESHNIFSFPGDTTDRAAMSAIVSGIEAAHGPIALAFLNAGGAFIAERDGFWADLVWRTFEINVGGTVNCLDPVLAAMKRRGKGQIALTSSLAGYGGIAGSSGYVRPNCMAEALRLSYEQAGLTIQIVNPGFVHTAMTASGFAVQIEHVAGSINLEAQAVRIAQRGPGRSELSKRNRG
jgi:NAD(P)-dependent dehydrogenase (short-subunit alcohol dehydrogenase family)